MDIYPQSSSLYNLNNQTGINLTKPVDFNTKPKVNGIEVALITEIGGGSGGGSLLTSKIIYVDAGVGTDTRTELNNYDLFKPFATIATAVAYSVTGDLVYVRAGSYTISTQISLNDNGNIYFETGTTVTIPTSIVAFSFSSNNAVKYIKGNADFILQGSAGILTMPSGNSLTGITFECNSIYSLTTVSGTLFSCAVGVLFVDAKAIQLDSGSFSSIVFNITGSGRITTRIPFVYCGRFLTAEGNNPGSGFAIAQINADIWTLVTYDAASPGMAIKLIATSFRIVNYIHAGVGVAFNWTENTIGESHAFRGINWKSTYGASHISFNSSADSASSKIIKLDQTNIMQFASSNSLNSNVAINVATYGTFSSTPAAIYYITFKIGSFTVDADVNTY
jgi:hypothetical protein